MVNKATGEAAAASMDTVLSTGPGNTQPMADARPPSRIDQGMGLDAMPLSELRTASQIPCPPARSSRDSAMQAEVVRTMSMAMVTITGPALCAPSSAASMGTPMKPVFGKAATSAPNAASFQPRRACVSSTVAPTISTAQSR